MPGLDCLAREYAARFAADGHDPDRVTLEHLAHHCGIWTQPDDVHAVTAPDEAALTQHLEAQLAPRIHGAVGVGAVTGEAGRATAVLLRLPHDLTLDPLPRAAPAGAPVTVSGRVKGGDGPLLLLWDAGDGVQRTPLEEGDTGRFEYTLEVSVARPLRLEIVRQEGDFLRSLARMTQFEATPDGYPVPRAAEIAEDRAEVRSALYAAADRIRTDAGLRVPRRAPKVAPLLDDWLSRADEDERTVRRAPPGLTDDRGWPYLDARYAFAAGPSAEAAVASLADAPSGRWLLLDPELDALSFGFRRYGPARTTQAQPVPTDGIDVVVVGLRRFEVADAASIRPAAVAAILAARARAGGPALRADPGLDAVAQELADALVAGELTPDALPTRAIEAAAAAKAAAGAIGAGAESAVEPTALVDLAAGHPLIGTPQITAIGIGIAGGRLPGPTGPRNIIVLVGAEQLPGDG